MTKKKEDELLPFETDDEDDEGVLQMDDDDKPAQTVVFQLKREHKKLDRGLKADLINLEHALNDHVDLLRRWREFLFDIQNPAIYKIDGLGFRFEGEAFIFRLGALDIELRPRFTKEKKKGAGGKPYIEKNVYVDFHLRDIYFDTKGEKKQRYSLLHTMQLEELPKKGPLQDIHKFAAVVYGIVQKLL